MITTTTDQILELLGQQARTRHELQAALGWRLSTLESALTRLRQRHAIEAQRLPRERHIGTRPGMRGRPKRASVVYCLARIG